MTRAIPLSRDGEPLTGEALAAAKQAGLPVEVGIGDDDGMPMVMLRVGGEQVLRTDALQAQQVALSLLRAAFLAMDEAALDLAMRQGLAMPESIIDPVIKELRQARPAVEEAMVTALAAAAAGRANAHPGDH